MERINIEKVKSNNPELYYLILDWKDKNLERFHAITKSNSLRGCNYENAKLLLLEILNDAQTK